MTVAAVILAAGASRRMGQPKALLRWGNSTLLKWELDELMRSSVDDIVVVTGRYADNVRRSLGDGALPPEVAVQFIVDHLARPDTAGHWTHLLPPAVDAALVEAKIKGKPGPLSFSTVSHRLAVLAKWHRLRRWDNPSEAPSVKTLLREARKAQARQGVSVRKKTAVVLEPLQAMLATCTDGVRGTRDRALLLLAWSGGGRRRSEIVGLQIEDLRRLDADTWLYALGTTKTDSSGVRREKPLQGPAAQALNAWFAVAPACEGPLFRRLYKGGRVASAGLSGD